MGSGDVGKRARAQGAPGPTAATAASLPTAATAAGLSATPAANSTGIEKEFELPQASVGRILKRKLPEGVTVSKEARLAFAKAGGIFILYLTHASNTFCRNDRRQTVSARDVFDGLRCIQFEDFIEPLEKSLQGTYFISFNSAFFISTTLAHIH
ncbi:Nuclear transcription factor Y subunit B [Hondaea fermentalgiana]|uniref:Nuclear transcription factor Y subunit B n=1 Tax=Hondaea fermentalgiana TaxID=2315210 RepID=A0A2R5GT52_9STRA|nr:Nuclear transcription factor Y subunit B [Hondaea fermentalgiana]|eukprot:GBG32938.1 Nuclear transcription factor Y subunit B [Hondaea fermentalgiana]